LVFINSLHVATEWSGMEKPMHLPSAGMIRFRFDGFAFASQPVTRHPEVLVKINQSPASARAGLW
jgi:hypothetical protein